MSEAGAIPTIVWVSAEMGALLTGVMAGQVTSEEARRRLVLLCRMLRGAEVEWLRR